MTAAGNRDFEKIYMDNFSYVYNFIYMKVLNAHIAEDICSTTFLKAFEKFDEYDPSLAGERTWLCVIARNTVIDHAKSGYTRRTQLVEEYPEIPVNDETQEKVIRRSAHEEVERLLGILTDEERELISMRYGMGIQVKEIADMLGVTPNSTTHRITRALEKCRKYEEKAGNKLTDFI
jgi:RNA polymerase sigma-70 factor (ECF subfamily)